MENNVQIFSNELFGNVRIIDESGTILFCGSDVAKALGYSKPHNALATHCRCALKRGIPHPQNPEKEIEMIFIPEGDVYRLIVRSNLSEAERFEKWVFDEVLPSIRKHGTYMTPNVLEQAIANPDFMIGLLQNLKDEQEKRKIAEQKVVKLSSDLDHAENVIGGFVDDISSEEKRQRINKIVRYGSKDKFAERWSMLYQAFERKYHCDLARRLADHKNEFTPQLKNKMDVIDRQMDKIPQLYEVACKIFENDVEKLFAEWRNIIE